MLLNRLNFFPGEQMRFFSILFVLLSLSPLRAEISEGEGHEEPSAFCAAPVSVSVCPWVEEMMWKTPVLPAVLMYTTQEDGESGGALSCPFDFDEEEARWFCTQGIFYAKGTLSFFWTPYDLGMLFKTDQGVCIPLSPWIPTPCCVCMVSDDSDSVLPIN